MVNKAKQDAIKKRREYVARFRLQGLTMREISLALASLKEPILHDDGAPISHVTIKKDLDVLKAEWQKNAAEDVSIHQANQLAEIMEAKRKAWTNDDLQALARFLKLESDIRGTAAPVKHDDWTGKDWLEYVRWVAKENGKTVEQVKADVLTEADELLGTGDARREVAYRPEGEGHGDR